MVNEEARNSTVIDPLSAYSGVSLFPRIFGILPDPSKPRDHVNCLDDMHKHLKSMVTGSPSKLAERGKTILDGYANFVNPEIATRLVANEKEEPTAEVEENPQERRPALNRKRARFSLKPDARQPAVNLEPALDIKQLKDPEEFFLAYERFENAKREIQKQTGGILKDLNQQNPSMNTRQRRPGILGRSVRYKHQYSSITPGNDENVVPSQATFELGNINPSTTGSEKDHSPLIIHEEKETDEEALFEETELVASVTKSENKVNKILDLLSSNGEDLEGDRTISILQEHLRIKPIHLEKLCLSDLQDIQTINLNPSRGNFPKHSLKSVENPLERTETVKFKQDAENYVHPLISSTPLKSPLAALSSLKRKILPSNSSNDPFSAYDFDQSPTGNHSPFEPRNILSDRVDIVKQSSDSKLKSLLFKDSGTLTDRTNSPKISVGDVDPMPEISSSNVLHVPQVGTGATSSETDPVSLDDNDIGGSHIEGKMNEELSFPEAQADALENASDDKTEEHEELVSKEPDMSMVDAIEEPGIHTPSQLDQSIATSSENIVDGLSKNGGTNHTDKVMPKSRANKQRKNKKNSRRQSLAAAGTKWQSGVRRSTRIRSRPLEYWKGERLLYGRVHESLATVIGMKYVSPGKGIMKVKSFVSDEYKELVELAALH